MNGVTKHSARYVCQSCGENLERWSNRCPNCGAWHTVIEDAGQAPSRIVRGRRQEGEQEEQEEAEEERPVPVTASEAGEDVEEHVPTGIGELDRVMGGGVVLGGVTLLGGPPGVGKSSLFLQALGALAEQGVGRTLYISGEESQSQIGARIRRFGLHANKDFLILATRDMEDVRNAIEQIEPTAIVIDSVQVMRAEGLESAAGTVSQLREVTAQIIEICKNDNIAAFLIGHVTKDGALAGPKVLEHLVDTTLEFEGEKGHSLRILRSDKNRFGPTGEIGVFEMGAQGMIEVTSPSVMLLRERWKDAPGSIVAASCEGSRPLLVEVQALATASGTAKRITTGVDANRLALVLAVLRGVVPVTSDVFVNLAGGAKVAETGLDLAIALAVASSALKAPAIDVAVFGEVGLNGEVRSVGRAETRLMEIANLGFERAIVPASCDIKVPGLQIKRARSVGEACALALGHKLETASKKKASKRASR